MIDSARRGPSLFDAVTEMPRTLAELASLPFLWDALVQRAPRAQPHPVLVLPGFLGDDASTMVLRRLLTRLRYKAYPWLQGRNSGNPEQLESVMRMFYRMHHSLGCPIALVGQSLGGVYAREIAKAFPEAVRCVITLGSPYGASGDDVSNPVVQRLFREMSGMSVQELRARIPASRVHEPLAVPATSIYSLSDGVVLWRACIEPETERSENIRVLGSHAGMAVNPDVLWLVANRLAQEPERWQRFEPSNWVERCRYPAHTDDSAPVAGETGG